ncbi:hypothetical protein A2U01_0073029 [Trifolium medium]|uniref:Uncharacterized protein n=1 Tax=Trifolium medium TaxID=97028 RepID=A0A392SUP6_9FABA|nr:hypothetical protein [Trifolium medium]
MRFWVDWSSKSRVEQPVLLQVTRQRSYVARRDKLASCRQYSPNTGQFSVSVSPVLASDSRREGLGQNLFC